MISFSPQTICRDHFAGTGKMIAGGLLGKTRLRNRRK